nr:immunoglobulin light chain junction region [Macaca mulatta]MOX53845.1 immunoglobulin light chain junction region [Macaca mulatta]MOX54151.1 immunoglobulin light chain junction region [Macaca mulatta]MOX55362.1 immunoglobulin light chain junction region [Macaca mulatta]MOX55548.1 immunoglobulin light chain junction region [Macaca mulatta]
CQQGYSNPFTF